MNRCSCIGAAFALVLTLTADVRAGRVPSTKTTIIPSSGARVDITVPYTTNGRSTLGVYNGVSPAIEGNPAPSVAPGGLQSRPMFNLIFYGSWQSPGSWFFGAVERPPNQLRPGK